MIKVVVSTLETQGDIAGDFTWVPPGELVGRYGPVCGAERADRLGGWGCGRAFGGFSTHKSTTTAIVAETKLTRAQWKDTARRALDETGWSTGPQRAPSLTRSSAIVQP